MTKSRQTTREEDKTAYDDGFVNVPVTKATRKGLHHLKESMGVGSQAEVIEKLVAIGMAIEMAARK